MDINSHDSPYHPDAGSDRPVRTRWASLRLLLVSALALTLTACNSIATEQYEATATVTYTWQVKYSTTPVSSKFPRQETFASNTLVNRNGQKPEGALTGPDDRGLWWPPLPPRPSLEEMEKRQQPNEKPGTPELLKDVKYELSYQLGAQTRTLPTNYQVYREVAKAYPSRLPLKFTLGVDDASVDKAESN